MIRKLRVTLVFLIVSALVGLKISRMVSKKNARPVQAEITLPPAPHQPRVEAPPVQPPVVQPAEKSFTELPPVAIEPPVSTAVKRPVKPRARAAKKDDLTVIRGIGPKIAGVLDAAGVTTYAKLAATPVSKLQEIMLRAGLRLAQPQSWPEQARLAASGDLEALQSYQNQLNSERKA